MSEPIKTPVVPLTVNPEQDKLDALKNFQAKKDEAYKHLSVECAKAQVFAGKRKYNPFFFIQACNDLAKKIENKTNALTPEEVIAAIAQAKAQVFIEEDAKVNYEEPSGSTRQINSATENMVHIAPKNVG